MAIQEEVPIITAENPTNFTRVLRAMRKSIDPLNVHTLLRKEVKKEEEAKTPAEKVLIQKGNPKMGEDKKIPSKHPW